MKRTLLVLVGFIVGVVGAGAQQGNAVEGLVVNRGGDLYKWDGTQLLALTVYGINGYPIQSPDGRYIAYLSASERSLETARFDGGTRPMNIWVLDRQTGEFSRVADDAIGFRFRGEPAWSPDSTRLAWTELADGTEIDGTLDLITYDVQSNTRRRVTDRFTHGPSDGGLYMPPVQWGDAGISQLYATVIMGPNPGQMIFELYDPNNGARTSYTVGQIPDTYIVDYLWVTHRGAANVAFVTRDGTWWALNPANGAREELAVAPTLQTTFGILNITVRPRFVGGDSGLDFAWDATFEIQGAATQTVVLSYLSPLVRAPYTPALGGEGVVYNSTGTVAMQTLDGVMTISNDPTFGLGDGPLFGGAVWYSTAWQTSVDSNSPPLISPTPVVLAGCPLPPRLSPGQLAAVTDGVPNNLRAEPGLEGTVFAQLPAGTIFEIVGGPVCVDGFVWYEVLGTEWRGWTAEGRNGEYWLEVFMPSN